MLKSLVAPSSRARLNRRSSENHRRTPDNAQPVRVSGASELARPKAPFGTAKTTNKRACWTHLNCGKVLDCCSFQPALQMGQADLSLRPPTRKGTRAVRMGLFSYRVSCTCAYSRGLSFSSAFDDMKQPEGKSVNIKMSHRTCLGRTS